ncbi:hypothetical protein STEG23_037884, partial [Scotinomys teguina]
KLKQVKEDCCLEHVLGLASPPAEVTSSQRSRKTPPVGHRKTQHASILQFQFAVLSGGPEAHVGKFLVYMKHPLELTFVFSVQPKNCVLSEPIYQQCQCSRLLCTS